jgi:hypothetical protein
MNIWNKYIQPKYLLGSQISGYEPAGDWPFKTSRVEEDDSCCWLIPGESRGVDNPSPLQSL